MENGNISFYNAARVNMDAFEMDSDRTRVHRAEARKLSNEALRDAIAMTANKLLEKYSKELALKFNAYYDMYLYDRPVDTEIAEAHKSLVTKYGRCFDALEGQCVE
jgi:hypothetical protein